MTRKIEFTTGTTDEVITEAESDSILSDIIRAIHKCDLLDGCSGERRAIEAWLDQFVREYGYGLTWRYAEPKARPIKTGDVLKWVWKDDPDHWFTATFLFVKDGKAHYVYKDSAEKAHRPAGQRAQNPIQTVRCTITHEDGTPIDWEASR